MISEIEPIYREYCKSKESEYLTFNGWLQSNNYRIMIPVEYVPVNFDHPIMVYQVGPDYIIFDKDDKEVTREYEVNIKKVGTTETVLVSKK